MRLWVETGASLSLSRRCERSRFVPEISLLFLLSDLSIKLDLSLILTEVLPVIPTLSLNELGIGGLVFFKNFFSVFLLSLD